MVTIPGTGGAIGTGKALLAEAAAAMGAPAKYRVPSRPMVRIVGWFQPVVGELHEMLYQNDSPYLFDSSKYMRAFGFPGTSYAEGIRATAASYGKAGRGADSLGAEPVDVLVRILKRQPGDFCAIGKRGAEGEGPGPAGFRLISIVQIVDAANGWDFVHWECWGKT